MPTLPMQGAPPATFGRRASGADFGGAEADAVAQRGGALPPVGGIAAEAVLYGQRLKDAADDAQESLSVAEYGAGLDDLGMQLELDPDVNTHEARFEKGADDLLKKIQDGLPDGRRRGFEERAFSTRSRARLGVVRNVHLKRRDQGLAATDKTVDLGANSAGRARDPRDRETIRIQTLGALDSAKAGGLIDQAGYNARVERFDKRLTESLAQAGKNTNPEATLAAVKAREGGFERMDEGRRQQWIETLGDEIKQRERIEKAERAEAEVKARQAEMDMQREAEQHGYFAAADGLMTVDWVKENRDRLSPGAVRYFLGVAEKAEAVGMTDPREVYRLEVLRAANPKAFAAEKIDPTKVGPRKAVEFLQSQAKARKEDFVPTGRSFNSRLASRLGEMKGLDDDERGELFRVGESDLQHFSEQKGGRPTPDEEQSIIDDVLLRRVVRSSGFLGFGRDTAVLPAGAPLEIPSVPAEYVDQIVDSLKRGGKPVTPEAIRERYDKAKALGLVK